MSEAKITLTEVQQRFETWRSKKLNNREPIPTCLKLLVSELIDNYPRSKITSQLKISNTTFYEIKNMYKSQLSKDNTTPDFVQVKLAELDHNMHLDSAVNDLQLLHSGVILCEISKANGAKLVIHATCPEQIIQAFLCCN